MPGPSSDCAGLAETAVGAVGPAIPHAAIPNAAEKAAVTEPRIKSVCLNVIVHLVEEPEIAGYGRAAKLSRTRYESTSWISKIDAARGNIAHVYDLGMIQRGENLRLSPESRESLGVSADKVMLFMGFRELKCDVPGRGDGGDHRGAL